MNQGLVIFSLVLLAAILLVLWLSQYKTVKEFYDTGEVRRIYRLKNNQKQGIEKVYYKSGELNKEKHWKHGVPIGKSVTYYRTGEKYIIDTYNSGNLVDTVILNTACNQAK